MKHFRKLRRGAAVAALAGLAVAAVVGFAHNLRPGPDYTGGLTRSAAVVQSDPGNNDG